MSEHFKHLEPNVLCMLSWDMQATFDTDAEGGWTPVYIPWHNFLCVKQAQSDPEGPALDPSKISKLGLVLSRFEFNKSPNPLVSHLARFCLFISAMRLFISAKLYACLWSVMKICVSNACLCPSRRFP